MADAPGGQNQAKPLRGSAGDGLRSQKLFLLTRPAFYATLLFIAGCGLSFWISILQHGTVINRKRDSVTLGIDHIRNNLSRELYATINLTQGLVALVRMQGGMRQDQFDAMARELLGRSTLIRNVALAPENVIRFIYPLAGNEKALGLNYLKTPDQAGAVLRAIEEKSTVVAGPVRLVQGGVGIIGRTPIFLPYSSGTDSQSRYWGIAATVIDFDSLVRTAGIDAAGANLRIALRGTDGTGAAGSVFWGDSGIFPSNPVLMEIPLPSGTWQLGAMPLRGWPAFNPLVSVSFLTGFFISLFFSMLLFKTLRISQSRSIEIVERKHAEDEIRKLNSELESRVVQRTAELVVARDRAQSADRLKSAFLATMSHELRTPLNSIIGFTGIILQGLVGEVSAEQRKQLNMVRDSAVHLLALINDVLDISKIESGQLELRNEVFPLQEAIDKSIQIVRPMAQKKSLPVSTAPAPFPLPEVYSDRRRVEQVLINLLGNAVKFTDSGAITLTVGRSDKPGTLEKSIAGKALLRISITDTGIGIKAQDIERLFKPFKQIDSGTTRRYEGTGLGLSICKKLAGMLGGDIEVTSGGPGKGSCFTFTLPEAGEGNG